MPKFLQRTVFAVLILALIGAIAYYAEYYRHGRFVQETNDASIQADQVSIASKLTGYVRRVAVTDDQAVAAGGLLVEIDPSDYATRLQSAEADIATALAARDVSHATLAETETAIDQARSALAGAQTLLDFATREVARYQPLVTSGAEPAATLSQLVANRERAAADVSAQRAALEQAQRHVATVTAQLGQVSAQVESAAVQRRGAANDLSAARLKSPIAGRVANRTVRVGQFVQPGMRLMTIVPAEDAYVVANFKETQVGLMRPGQPAVIRVDALPGVHFHGVVTSVSPGTGANFSLIPPQNATGNFTKIVQRVPVRIRIQAGPIARRVLVPGMSLEVEVDTSAKRAELDAIRAEQEGRGR